MLKIDSIIVYQFVFLRFRVEKIRKKEKLPKSVELAKWVNLGTLTCY